MPMTDALPPDNVLDPNTLNQLLDLDDGQLGLIQEMYQLFVEDMPPRIAAMEVAHQAGKASEMGDIAHAVKGAASTMGAPRVRAVALALETLGRTGKGNEDPEVLLARLRVEYDAAQRGLLAFIEAQGAAK